MAKGLTSGTAGTAVLPSNGMLGGCPNCPVVKVLEDWVGKVDF